MTASRNRRKERGVTAVMVVLVIGVLCALVALVMNSGHLMAVRGQLQNATDSAALAGVRELNGSVAGFTTARTVAAAYAQQHITDKGMNVTIDPDADVQIGHWDFAAPRASAFTEITGTSPADLANANAVLVNARRDASHAAAGGPVQVIMGGLEYIGKDETDVGASSVAVGGGPSDLGDCGLMPLAFSSCAIKEPETGKLLCDKTLTFNKDGADNMGFTNLTPTSGVTPPTMNAILDGVTCPKVSVGDPIWIGNGAEIKPTLTHFEAHLHEQILVPIVDVPDCKFVSSGVGGTVTGFMTIEITSVNGPPANSISIKCDCVQSPVETAGGGAAFGTTVLQPQLVR